MLNRRQVQGDGWARRPGLEAPAAAGGRQDRQAVVPAGATAERGPGGPDDRRPEAGALAPGANGAGRRRAGILPGRGSRRGRAGGAGAVPGRRVPWLDRERWLSVVSPIALLLIWELMVRAGMLDPRFFPPPSRIAVRFAAMVADGTLAQHLGISLLRVILGFAAGAIPAVILGLTMGLFPLVRAVLEPIVAAIYPIPKIALLPLLLMIFGVGEAFKVVTIALGCFTLVLVNTVAGVVNIERIYVDVARNFGASRLDFYRTVAWPGALPMIFAGLKLGMGVSLLLIVAAEMIGARSGLGYLIWNSYQVWDMAAMFIGLVLMSFFGYAFTMALNELERLVLPWRPR
ncbi:ABC transporter permease [Thermaerobacter subterraneus]|uniref:ABC-type nitrate/sulfonate/bicarbonate transport system, permease component n=1 Tax=Thermaerobacter subterraneus DSM 13965 TaxID=867903 RepID=K6Q0B9_9FIRM|nr:ABC transporter permease [Thermaerobacter subterraneus]EKP94344.1 ABC-type nitrate/sulfonate/bicarbonate transport system, permease component [Thermaerobacter subterraneus DSM 13965]